MKSKAGANIEKSNENRTTPVVAAVRSGFRVYSWHILFTEDWPRNQYFQQLACINKISTRKFTAAGIRLFIICYGCYHLFRFKIKKRQPTIEQQVWKRKEAV
ncbi:MAG: hypothetical protein P4L75_02030 [Clostridia bacterium]|nr:hypothetical protein [Clostridia bacterium]MDR3645225.1 hypothetical protein [Clostridia bacterium]